MPLRKYLMLRSGPAAAGARLEARRVLMQYLR